MGDELKLNLNLNLGANSLGVDASDADQDVSHKRRAGELDPKQKDLESHHQDSARLDDSQPRQKLEMKEQGQQLRHQFLERTEKQRDVKNDIAALRDAFKTTSDRLGHELRGNAYGQERRFAEARTQTNSIEHVTTAAAVEYLRGAVDGKNLPPDVRRALDIAADTLGRDFLKDLTTRRSETVASFIDHTVERTNRLVEHETNHSFQPSVNFQETVDELVSALELAKHFDVLEKTGGPVVRQAEATVARLLYGDQEHYDLRRLNPAELLRDLRAGAFLSTQTLENPFPLTGRARIASEMMELMRTLDAIERFAQRAQEGGEQSGLGQGVFGALGHFPELPEGLPEELLMLLPLLPGSAGRNEMARLIASLGGALPDKNGKPLLAPDGTPLKLGQLLWLSSAGGMTTPALHGGLSGTHPSSLLLYGFDAVYSAIGFDGRTLQPPRFVAVQVQINGSELEWVFGQPPMTEGWMRALIERLKDSVVPDHNLLGEMLEEAILDERFYAALVRGNVSEGQPATQSFTLDKFLPEATGPSLAYA